MRRLDMQQTDAVRDALRRSHRDLVALAEAIPTAERSRRSYCTEGIPTLNDLRTWLRDDPFAGEDAPPTP